ncbi:MmpS family transport accessory protein [Plantibacter sp. Mn2098]|uniref:MmpS family transport accessory protein n=1 Tax=Plantibacter sp. Mn2098 TaxID=3395266 RepID=UPI003BBCC5F1
MSIKKFICVGAVIATLALAGCSSTSKGATPAVEEKATTNTVTYEVTSDGATGSVTYMTFNNGGVGQEQANDAPLPFTKEIALEDEGAFATSIFSLTAQAAEGATTISCKITANGEVVAEQTSTGEYAVVACSGSSK